MSASHKGPFWSTSKGSVPEMGWHFQQVYLPPIGITIHKDKGKTRITQNGRFSRMGDSVLSITSAIILHAKHFLMCIIKYTLTHKKHAKKKRGKKEDNNNNNKEDF